MNRRATLFRFTLILLGGFLAAACDETLEGRPDPTPQDVELTVSYSGTAKSLAYTYKNLNIDLYEPGAGSRLAGRNFSVTLENLRSGYTKRIYSELPPGNYEVEVWLDWNGDGSRNNFEPRGNPDPLEFEVEGYDPVILQTELLDRTSPTDNGWLRGTLTYSGSKAGYHHVYVRVSDTNFDLVVEGNVTIFGLGLSADQLRGGYGYALDQVPPGFYYALAYWDVNDNGYYDGDPHGSWTFAFYVSPGLPTVDIDHAITD